MKRNLFYFVAFFFLQIGIVFGQDKPKYIFYMIGDGMGLNHVNVTESYLASKQQKNTVFPLTFTQFPYGTFATSYSLSHPVTDSAAAGTALATGHKTRNGVIGMDSSATVPYKSIAYYAKENGLKVGITTTVTINHATPGAFYASQANRSMGYEIGLDLIRSDFDFFGGSGFANFDQNAKKEKVESLLTKFENNGYTISSGIDEYQKIKHSSEKIILMDNKGIGTSRLPFAIDQKPDDLTLSQIVTAAIESLSRDNDNGFFLMVEGGMIDHASHANDGATTIHETLDFDEAVKIAFDFYQKHPEETLIVVTADHETGGMSIIGGNGYLPLQHLAHQKVSQNNLSSIVSDLRKTNPNATWEEVKQVLSENTGLWTAVKVSKADEEEIHESYKRNFIKNENETSKSLYATDNKIATLAIKALNKAAGIGWGTGGHSAAYVPVYAIGVGAELFSHKMENIDIPLKISQIAGWNMHLLAANYFQEKINVLDNAIVLDVRTPGEYREGHIDHAININWNSEDFSAQIEKLNKYQPVLIYCKGGGRSAAAKEALTQAGFKSIYELEGGITKWQEAELPVVR